MDAYSSFAQVYDQFMDNIPYDNWTDNIKRIFDKYNMPMEIVCDLGCGTGQITRRLRAKGYDMIGIDYSQEMLMQAINHEQNEGILYLCQDMRSFELYGTVGAVVSFCDSMNYLSDYEELKTVCSLVNNYLDPQGLFVFDMKTISYFEKLGVSTIAENRENSSFIWENEYDADTRDNQYYLTLYVENEQGCYDRFEEEHIQHAFSVDEVKKAILESGLKLLAVVDAESLQDAGEDSDRLIFIAREVMK